MKVLDTPALRGFVFAFGCLTAACVETGVGAPARGPNPAAVSAVLARDLRNPDAARESVFGDAVLFTAPGLGVAIALDGGATPGMQDGYVDQVFILQQQEPTPLEARSLRSAEVFFAGRLLLVRAENGVRAAFMVQAAGDPEPAADRLPFTAEGAERFQGFGMSRRTGAWEVALDEAAGASMASLLPACAPPPSGEVSAAGTCDSGGEGSTSCSTSCATVSGGSCSTSCGGGYYSCCNKGSCSCTCVASGGGGGTRPPINMTSVPGARRP